MLQTSTVKKDTLGLLKDLQAEPLLASTRMLGYVFDFKAIEKRIVKMTDNPDKVYVQFPLKQGR